MELQFGRPDDIKPDPVVAGHPAAALYRRWPRRQGPAAKQRSRQRAALFQASRACLVGLDWIGLTGGYWCRHYSKDCSQAQALPF